MTVTVQAATITEEQALCFSIRHRVFVDEQQVDPELEYDGLDDQAFHLLALVDGQAAGTLRIRFPNGMAKIERVAVLQEFRTAGIGAALTRAALDRIRAEPGVEKAVLGAQVSVIGFYEKFGFVPVGPEFTDAGIPHQMMELKL